MLQLAGGSISGLAVAGCLSNADPGRDNDDPDGDDPGGDGDVDVLSIDGRLHNEDAAVASFGVTIRDADGAEVASEEWAVEPGETVAVPAFGRPGEPRTFEVTVGEVTATESLAFDVEQVPRKKAGYVDIMYTGEAIEIVFTPLDRDVDADDLPRVDTPPYLISEPACGAEGERDPLWLCANMDAEPSLAFDQVETTGALFADEGLTLEAEPAGEHQFYTTLLTAVGDLDRLDEDAGGEPMALIEETDFDIDAVLVVQTGWGSGSETPHLKRIEETDTGVHAFGCYRRPCAGTDDFTMRTVVARFERPAQLEEGVVSLTVDPEHRVNVETGEGVVTADRL